MFQVMRRYLPPPPADPPPSPFEWGRLDRLRERLGPWFNLGFERGVSAYREPDGAAAWHTFSTGYGPTRTLVATLDEERRADLRREFIAFHDEYSPTSASPCPEYPDARRPVVVGGRDGAAGCRWPSRWRR